MFQKAKILFFSTTVLTFSALSVQAMDPEAQKATRAQLRRTKNNQRPDLYQKNPNAGQLVQPAQPVLALGILEEEFQKNSHSESLMQDDTYTTDDDFGPSVSLTQDELDESTKETRIVLKDFDKNSAEYMAAVNYYEQNYLDEPKKLCEYLESLKPDQKITPLQTFESDTNKFRLDHYKVTEEGLVVNTPTKLKGMSSIREYLSKPDSQPELIFPNKINFPPRINFDDHVFDLSSDSEQSDDSDDSSDAGKAWQLAFLYKMEDIPQPKES